LRNAGIIALDTETRDGGLAADRGSAWPWGDGHVCGVAAAWRSDGSIKSCYIPIKHPDTENFDGKQVFAWLRDLISSDVRFVTHNGVYDWGWLRTEMGVQMPPPERMEEIGALATLVDENRHKYSLESLCAWRGLPGKDETLLKAGAEHLGVRPKDVKSHLWRLPAHYVGPYAETDAARTLELFESLDPIIDQEGTRAAYRLECDLLPMVLEMRRRGIRVDQTAAENARDLILKKRDAALSELSDKLEAGVEMQNLRSPGWLAARFDAHRLTYPRTERDNPSFRGEWMRRQRHWLPQLIATAGKYDRAGTVFLEKHVLANVINGRIHAEIYPHRSEDNGTRSFRFSYADPPLQQMPKRNEELATLIRAAFLPEPGDAWATLDASQQEFRLLVHYAAALNLTRAKETVERYRSDPKTDYHTLVADLTGLDRSHAKGVNFAKIYGAGPRKLAQMIGVSEGEARAMMCKYDGELPFAKQLAKRCERAIWNQGYLTLYGGARRHWETIDNGGRLVYPSTYKGLNALIQGSAAYHTKLWMRMCWRAGVVPMLQMHDALECSIASQELAETVARLGSEAVSLNVPMLIDVHCGCTWADAKHTWEELRSNGADGPFCETKEAPPPFDAGPEPEPQPEAPKSNGQEHSEARSRAHSNGYSNRKRTGGRWEAEFFYPWPNSAPYLKVVKMRLPDGDKYFFQQHMENGGWVNGAPDGPKIPYRLRALIDAPPDAVPFITEGESKADIIAKFGEKLGLVATTNPGGGIKGSWTADLNHWFRGRDKIYICEDNDDTGRAHTIEVATALSFIPDIRVIRFPELKEHGDVEDWLNEGRTVEELIERAKNAPKVEVKPKSDFRIHWLDDDDEPDLPWLVHDLITETGCGLIAGQWGTYKTSGALDLSAAIVTGADFIDYAIRRQAGVLYIAPEGSAGIKKRFQAILDEKYPGAGKAPFALVKACPRLLGKNAVEALAKIAEEAARRMLEEFKLPLGLINIDTVAKAAGYSKPGEENDAAVGAMIMDRLAELSSRSGAFVIGVDHFGKTAETGTRGTSAKESAADTILALLGVKDITGAVSNTRLAVRKVREGETGREIPFAVHIRNLGPDRFGKPVTAPIIDWKLTGSATATQACAEGWPKTLHRLRRALMATLAGGKARQMSPTPGAPPVQAIDYDTLRDEFGTAYPASGSAKAKVIGQAFKRALGNAQEQALIGIRNAEGATLIWMEPI
jgi:DNA polymerase I-like protein with 3'-5' exonuclease and polymerase domains